MAGKDIINSVDINNPSTTRRSSDLLPNYHRTDRNTKFLASTLDQFIQQPQIKRIDGFIGSKLSPKYDPENDQYIPGKTKLRTDYQLEPSLVISDKDKNIQTALGFDDLLNQISFKGGDVSNIDKLFRSSSFSYEPHIDWDKFVNFSQYYWMPTGPDSIEIFGKQQETQSTYTVTDSGEGTLSFNPPGSTNPLITLYRGLTYVFNVTSAFPFYVKTAYVSGIKDLYTGAIGNGTRNGQIIVTIDEFTPNTLFYFAEGSSTAFGQFVVKSIEENTDLDIDADILGKKSYTSVSGVTLSNGMKIRFAGNVTPESYIDKDWMVEGVGDSIKLIDFSSLILEGVETSNLNVNFDATPFDEYPFDDFRYVPLIPEYITINRAAVDKNAWSKYNRWVHQDVIIATAKANRVEAEFDSTYRGQRPIIEFCAGLHLHNHGIIGKANIDLIDNSTTNAFKIVENSNGYYCDGVKLEAGFRVIFNADTDLLVRGKIYEVKIVFINNREVINLEEVYDSEPILNESVLATRGVEYAGTAWWYNGDRWQYSQQRTSLNQAPLFELYDEEGNRFADQSVYKSAFFGTKIFGYRSGTIYDSVLGFNIAYRNVANTGEYVFDNFFMTDTFTISAGRTVDIRQVKNGFLKFNSKFTTVWTKTVDKPIPIIQYQVITEQTNFVEITAIDNPGIVRDLNIDVFVNDVKKELNYDFVKTTDGKRAFIVSTTTFNIHDKVLFKLYTSKIPNENGYYELPISLTNNPLNGSIESFTFTEVSDHVKTMIDFNGYFSGNFPGQSNLRDLGEITKYGSRLVSHNTPLSFAHYFLGGSHYNIIDAIRKVSEDYNQFKSNLIKTITDLKGSYAPAQALDVAMIEINSQKTNTFNYKYSDMIPYGRNFTTRVYAVTDSRNVRYSLATAFNTTVLSMRAVMVYLNNNLLVKDYDYTVSLVDPSIEILASLVKGDVITIVDYPTTERSFIPPTPTKLGLYPKFKPEIFYDTTYIGEPRKVIQGHDGSIMIAYNDYRDAIILEYETRVFNNIKVNYNSDLLNIDNVLPGAFRETSLSQSDMTYLISSDFLRWAGYFGVDYKQNSTFDELESFTFNYTGSIDSLSKNPIKGFWRNVYKYFYDTDRPHTHPWEMLGFREQPEWWVDTYGPAPYTSGNLVLWEDLEAGRIAVTPTGPAINPTYIRPGLSKIIPVGESGELISPTDSGLATTPIINPNDPRRLVMLRSEQIAAAWNLGDHSPAETAWFRSSNWPFAAQVLLALRKPADYAALMFDTSRMKKNLAGEYKYGNDESFISPSKVFVPTDIVNNEVILTTGYSVFVVEAGSGTDRNCVKQLKSDLQSVNYRLLAKLGAFSSKEKLSVSIDAVDPSSPFPGVLIPAEDYQIFFNKSVPIESISLSGMIIQKTTNGWSIRGYDKYSPYFKVFKPFASNIDQTERVGGVSESFVIWNNNITYNSNQVVFYNERYYRVKQKHNAGTSFIPAYYQSLPYLPAVGGVGVLRRTVFDNVETIIPYGVEFRTVQEVYDVILGYGQWLASKGFVFNEYNSDLDQVLDWRFTAKEFLYWTTQNWSVNSVITLSPFANKLLFRSSIGIVDSVVNSFYEYSLLKADGAPFPKNNFAVVRLDGEFSINTMNTQEGIFFARLNVTQKEHALVMNNFTLFNDIIYDVDTGYRQRRIKVKGFITDNWNGDFSSPGFIFDQAEVTDWERNKDYRIGSVVRFSGNYYSANTSISGTKEFDITQWAVLNEKPTPQLLPNFEYKINQFEDFYSLDIDNFDVGQQAMAQHLTGYTPRPYLNYIIGDPIAQYKFYQGFIRDKGTKKALTNLTKASLSNFRSALDFNEEWAFRIGYYGGYNTYQELETSLSSTKFLGNPQIIEFVETAPIDNTSITYYKEAADIFIKPQDFNINAIFTTSTDVESIIQMPTAGYVRFDDITATAFNKNSVLDIANNAGLKTGNVIWLGFREDGEWDVLRVTDIPTYISAVAINIPGESLTFTTYYTHQLAVGDLISVTGLASTIDQVYIVEQIVDPNRFVVLSTLTSLPALPDSLVGLIFAFKSSRLSTFNDLASVPYLDRWKDDEKIWIDSDSSGNWAVYKKTDNYSASLYNSEIGLDIAENQHYGSKFFTTDDSEVLLISSLDYVPLTGSDFRGRVTILVKTTFDSFQAFDDFTLNDRFGQLYYTLTAGKEPTAFGQSIAYNPTDYLIVVGAPKASRVKAVSTGTNIVDPLSTTYSATEQGVVKLSVINSSTYQLIDSAVVITTPTSANGTNFGWSLSLSSNSTTTSHKLVVGAPAIDAAGTGTVYVFRTSVSSSTISVTSAGTLAPTSPVAGSLFGYEVTGNTELSRVAVSAPGYISPGFTSGTTSSGAVYIFNNSGTQVQLIDGGKVAMGAGDTFGTSVKMSADSKFLFVASPYAYDPALNLYSGVVDIFTATAATTNMYVYSQRISAPVSALTSSTIFGWDISINETAEILTITSAGDSKSPKPTFDKYVERYTATEIANNTIESDYVNNPSSIKKKVLTTFDGGTTSFSSKYVNAGTAHVYNRLGGSATTKFAYAQQLIDTQIKANSMFGQTSLTLNDTVYVGAPAKLFDDSNGLNSGKGQVFAFNKIDTTINSWQEYRKQEPLVDLSTVKRVVTINETTEQIQDYIDVIDPIKGHILGTAAKEIRCMSPYDPAIYSLGISGVNINADTNWLDEHVGELWWDLSSVKYVWYEQGEVEYRKNNWNNLFPGSSIDVYEWVRSEYLPAEWAQLADTADGLTRGISGQPKFADNSVISVKQVYNSISNSFTNVYYFWVKNKVTVPNNVPNRSIACFEVAQQIADPVSASAKFMAIISPTAVSLANAKSLIKTETISLNIAFDTINDSANRHTEWQIISENDRNASFNWLIEKKLIDSLLGRDSLGNPVPDPTLPNKLSYGIEVRPRQSMFKDRIEALRNITEYVNQILLVERITDKIDFTNLEAIDELPSAEFYDAIVEDIFNLELIVTTSFVTAELTAEIDSNGVFTGVTITNSGFGYITAPTITIEGDGSGAILRAVIDEFGTVTSVQIEEPGIGYTVAATTLTVRPYTAIVQIDSTSQDKWALYEWNKILNKWVKMRTQDYNTSIYWNYVDWSDSTYDPLKNLSSTVAEPYALQILEILPTGSYVKVQNGGAGRYLILKRTDGTIGTFDSNWDMVYAERGTIQFSDIIWDQSASVFAWDQVVGFDQTQYSQTPDKELEFILLAIKNDIFIDDLKVYWNKLVFKAVRYALSEQKFLDWAFKTTFISVINNAGSLSQPATFKLESASYYEDFLNEIKPFHTKVRKFTDQYTTTELTNTFNTDFDLPVYWNTSTLNFSKVGFGNPLLLEYPWKSWYDNYAYQVETIEVYSGGSGYTQIPKVTIVAAPGDTGIGATAVAFVSLGKVTRIIVTNPGRGYTSTPTVVISGGGNTALTSAIAYAQLGNNPVRHNTLRMRFDRVTTQREVGNQYFTQSFICDGQDVTYKLDWVPFPDKERITLLRNGQLQLIDTFTIVYSKNEYVTQRNEREEAVAEYTKLNSVLKLSYVPNEGDILTITYPKSLDLYNAAARIEDYYEPVAGMPGKDLAQLMTGVEYSGLQVIGLPFTSVGGWDASGIAWAQNPYDNLGLEAGYSSYITTATSTQSFVISSLISTGTEVNVYLRKDDNSTAAGVRIDDEDFHKVYSVTSSSSLTNILTLASDKSITFKAGDEITFSGSGFGSLTTGTQFFVKAIVSATALKISTSDDVNDAELSLPTSGYPNLTMSVERPGAFLQTLVGLGTGAVERFEVIVPGKGYLGPYTTLSISAPNTLSGTNAQGTLVYSAVAATVSSGGTGYAVGDVLYATTSSGTALFTVTKVSTTSSVQQVKLTSGGQFIGTTPTLAIATTGSVVTATPAQLQLVFGISNINITNEGSGYFESPIVTITEAINPSNPTGSVTVEAYARSVLKAEFRNINNTETTSTIVVPSAAFGVSTSSLVMLRYSSSDGTVTPTDSDSLDSIINGGDLGMTTALGVNPAEIILDGGSTSTRHITGMMDDGFLNPINSYAPEECVPGQVQESLGISVYTQPNAQSPLIANRHYYVSSVPTTIKMGVKPSNAESIIVLFNNVKLPSSNYTVDYENNNITISLLPAPGAGWVSLTSLQIGALGLLDSLAVSTTSNKTVFNSAISISDVGSAYVTVNGVSVPEGTSENQANTYFLTDYLGATRVIVNKPGTVQIYLFRGTSKSFSEIREEFLNVGTATPTELTLNYPPGNAKPYHSQVFVTQNGIRLKPPVTTYYQVENGKNIFDVTYSQSYPLGQPDISRLEVYVNGVEVPTRNNWDLDQFNNRIIFNPQFLEDGDAVAIVFKEGHDYLIQDNKVVLTTAAAQNDQFVFTTFTNHDPDFIRTERFKASASNQYVMQRSILDSAYVWVTYNGKSLNVNLDYTVGTDGRTVTIRDGIFESSSHYVVITSFGNPEPLIAYRQFTDILGRNHFKRLSRLNTTILSQNFLLTDTMIAVEDATALTKPDPAHNRPGVVLIDGERIEYFVIEGNVLSQLRRSTLGTGPRDIHYAGTYVVDQGADQTIPFDIVVQRYTTATTTTTNEYDVTGIIEFNTSTLYADQIEVRYQGAQLLKPGLTTYSHDNSIAFDSTSTADTIVPYGFSVTTTGTVILNTASVTVIEDGRLEVIKRQSRTWYNRDATLAVNTTPQAKFISGAPASIPRFLTSSTYVPIDLTWYIEDGEALTDQNNSPLQGI
jgi:hypothetical protein